MKDVVMDSEKSREFYLDRYYRAIKQFGTNSLTAKICKKKLELLGTKVRQHVLSEDSSADESLAEDEIKDKSKLETGEVS